MSKTPIEQNEEDVDTAKRRDEALRRALNTPPRPREPNKPKGKATKEKPAK